MSDQTKYINAYVDTTVGILHEQLNIFLQTKAQLKVANDLVNEKDEIIATLQNQLATKTDEFNITNHSLMEARHWEAEYNSMKNKVSHMETLTNQLIDMKKIIQEKDEKFAQIDSELSIKNSVISEINSKLDSLVQQIKEKDKNINNLTQLIQEKDEKILLLEGQSEAPTPVINNKQKKKNVAVELVKSTNNDNSNNSNSNIIFATSETNDF